MSDGNLQRRGRALLLALESTDPPWDHDGRYFRDALLAANYSVPVLWLSLFDADGLMTWPGIHDGSPYTAVMGPASMWTEEISAMMSDEEWAGNLCAYLSGLDDPDSAAFREALAQSYLTPSGKGLDPFDKVGLVTAGYTWARQAPWEGAGHGPFFTDLDHSGCRICAR